MLKDGRAALDAWSWVEARAAFEVALSKREFAEAFDGLATAAAWLDDATTAITARERAYRLYRDRGNAVAVARMALGLADVALWHRGEPAVAAGWLGKARGLLADQPDNATLAWVDVAEGYLALAYAKDLASARSLSEQAVERARRARDLGAESVALAQLGLVLVSSGSFGDGMRLLDQGTALAISGGVADREAVATVCCYMVTACARVRDGDRTAQWTQHVMDLARDWTNRAMFTYPRTEHAALLVMWGRWGEAELELQSVIEEMTNRPLMATLGLIRLADLRRRQGRLDDADGLLDRADAFPYRDGAGLATLSVRASVAFDRGDRALAIETADMYLQAVPAEDRIERLDALAVLTRALAASGDVDLAAAAASEMAEIADAIPTGAFRASAAMAAGAVGEARRDYANARDAYQRAAALFDKSRAPLEAATARLGLARALLALGDLDRAVLEARRAQRTFVRLGARPASNAVATFLAEVSGRRATAPLAQLTPREAEIIRLVGVGRSNDEIAGDLVLSVRTVERHLSNIYVKVGAHGRIARAVATSYAHQHGLI